MAPAPEIANIQELLQGIRKGLVPRAVRLFAAQGMLPVSREDLIRAMVVLVAESDEEIAQAARTTLATFTTENFLQVLQLQDVDSLEIDLLVRSVRDDNLAETVVRHPLTANETLCWLARNGSARTQDVIVTNQMRLMGCLEILEELRANPQVSQEVLRRVHEFEEEFLQKATQWAAADTIGPEMPIGPSIEEALEALKALGMHIPGGEVVTAAEIEPDVAMPEDQRDAFLRIGMMNTFQRIMLALKGTREERLVLIRDRNLLVVRAVIGSPKLNESEVEHIAGMRSCNEQALRLIATRPGFLRRYAVVRNLAFNPKTPIGVIMTLIPRLSMRDLLMMGRDRNVAEAVRRVARTRLERRR